MLCGGIDGRKYDPLIVGRHFRRRALKKFDFDTIGVGTTSFRPWAKRGVFAHCPFFTSCLPRFAHGRNEVFLMKTPFYVICTSFRPGKLSDLTNFIITHNCHIQFQLLDRFGEKLINLWYKRVKFDFFLTLYILSNITLVGINFKSIWPYVV